MRKIYPCAGAALGLAAAVIGMLGIKSGWIFGLDSGYYGLWIAAVPVTVSKKPLPEEGFVNSALFIAGAALSYYLVSLIRGSSLPTVGEGLVKWAFFALLAGFWSAFMCKYKDVKSAWIFLSLPPLGIIISEALDLFLMFTHTSSGLVPMIADLVCFAVCFLLLLRSMNTPRSYEDEELSGEDDEEDIPMLTEDEKWLL